MLSSTVQFSKHTELRHKPRNSYGASLLSAVLSEVILTLSLPVALWPESWGISFPAILGTPQSVSEYGVSSGRQGEKKSKGILSYPSGNIASVVRRKIFLSQSCRHLLVCCHCSYCCYGISWGSRWENGRNQPGAFPTFSDPQESPFPLLEPESEGSFNSAFCLHLVCIFNSQAA